MTHETPSFRRCTLEDLTVTDERSFRHVGLYGDLKAFLKGAQYTFRVLPPRWGTWDRALLLNLTYWAAEHGGDVLMEPRIAADVVAHVAWHALAHRHVSGDAAGLILGESIASGFDLYLIGRLLGHAPDAEMLHTQVPALTDAALGAGVDEEAVSALLEDVATDPDKAFKDLRELLYQATMALYLAKDAAEALTALFGFEGHRFFPFLHHYELSNWVLYCRAFAAPPSGEGERLHLALTNMDDPLTWLESHWVRPALP